MSKRYTPAEVAVIVLKKAEELAKSAMAGLKVAKLTPVPGVISPSQSNTASPMKVGSQAVVKSPKAKKPGQAMDKPSVFFKSEEFQGVKRPSIHRLREFLEKQRNRR